MFIPPHRKPPNVVDILGPHRFRCSCCQIVARKAWSDEEVLVEHYMLNGTEAPVPTELLCDDCYDVALLMIRMAKRWKERRSILRS